MSPVGPTTPSWYRLRLDEDPAFPSMGPMLGR
jgi:hypothetical protein